MTTTDKENRDGWPERPSAWPAVLDDIEFAQMLRLDKPGRSLESAKRALRRLRQLHGLPSVGQIGKKVLTRREAVEAWLRDREPQREPGTTEPTVGEEGHENKGLAVG